MSKKKKTGGQLVGWFDMNFQFHDAKSTTQCGAPNKSGGWCKRKTKRGETYCAVHKKK